MFEFLQTREGQNIVAFVTFALIGIALLLKLHPFKNGYRATITDLWVAEDYYRYLITIINASRDADELEAAMDLVDAFQHKIFRVPISRFTRNRYYIMLVELYDKKEESLLKIPVELFPN